MREVASRTVSFYSGRGGTGKTTVCLNLGVAMARMGEDVIIFDGDSACPSLDIMLGRRPEPGRDFQAVLMGRAKIGNIIFEQDVGAKRPIRIIPAGHSLEGFLQARKLYTREKATAAFGELFRESDAVILVDAPAGLEDLAQMAIKVSNESFVVTVPEDDAISAAYKAYRLATTRLQANIGGTRGIILNKVTPDAHISEEEVETIFKAGVIASVPYDEKVAEAKREHKPVVVAYPNSPFSKTIKRAAEIMVKGKIPGELKPFRRPPRDEYMDHVISAIGL